jgi:esterase/lipase superfamily enzyme
MRDRDAAAARSFIVNNWRALRKSLSAFLILALMACSVPPALVGIDNPETPALSVPQISRHKIFIMTTRAASEVVGVFYSEGRAPELGLASVDVTVPPNHEAGELERARRPPPDPRTEFAIVDPAVYRTDSAFIAEIDRELARRPPGKREILLFVHGYNNTTTDAILRLGQFVEDTGFEGVPVLFTWASGAKVSRYVYDLNSALVARGSVKEMSDILDRTRVESATIFAHSMGSLLTMEGLVDAQQVGRLDKRIPIDTIVLASPDIDMDLFRTQIAVLPPNILDKMYVLTSDDDAALRVSRIIAGGVPRVGSADAEELEMLGLTVIDLSAIDDQTSSSHNKFASSPVVVQLVGAGLNNVGRFGVRSSASLTEYLANVPIRVLGN